MSVSSFYYRRSDPEDGLQASLDSHREEVLSWVDQGPLRLVAAALADMQGSGKAGDLQYKLENQVLGSAGVKWNNWWKKVQPSLKESAHFRIAKPNTYALAPGVRAENIPVEPLVVKARPKERSGARPTWNQWFKSKRWPLPDKESAPGAKPPDKIIADIGSCDSETIERLAPRTVACAEEFLTRPRITAPAAQKLLELLLASSSRYDELRGTEADTETAPRRSETLFRLLHTLQRDGSQSLLVESVKLAIGTPGWLKVLASGIWDAYPNNSAATRSLLEYLAGQLKGQERKALWHGIALAPFSSERFAGRTADLDRILSLLNLAERNEAVKSLILRASLAEVPESEVACFVATSRYALNYADGLDKLNLTVITALLLSEVRPNFLADLEENYRSALNTPQPEGENSVLSALLKAARERISEVRNEGMEELERERMLRHSQVTDLENRIQGLRTQIAENREESRLDIRRDMLEAVIATLQGLQRKETSPEDLLQDVEGNLKLAVQAGGAQFFGKAGDVVEYDPRLHQGAEGTLKGALVTVNSPGALVPGKLTGDFVLLKARVNSHAEVK